MKTNRIGITQRAIRCLATAVLAAILPQANAQTLNEAVVEQLETLYGVPCAVLLGGTFVDDALVPGSSLHEICNRPVSLQGDPVTSGGGSAATPPSQPSSVEVRLDEEDPEDVRRGFFFSVGYDSIDKDVSPFEDGYDSDVVRFVGGLDTLIDNNWVLGVVADTAQQSGDFVGEGDFETTTYGVTGFGSFLIGDSGSFDFYAGFAGQSHDRTRGASFKDGNSLVPPPPEPNPETPFEVTGTPNGDFDSGQILFGVNFSYDWSWDNVTVGPRISYDYLETDFDGFTETDPDDSGLALAFEDNSETSSLFSAGVAGSVALSTGFGVVLLEPVLLYRYETGMEQRDIGVSFAGDPRRKRFTFQTDEPDESFLQYSIITRMLLANHWEWMLQYTGITSHSYLSRDAVMLGFRKGF